MKPFNRQRARRRAQLFKKRPPNDPFTSEARSPMEILSRLAGRTNFITPKKGGSSNQPLTDQDIAQAIASSEDKLGAAMAFAIAAQAKSEKQTVMKLGEPRVLYDLMTQHEMPRVVRRPYTFRATLATSIAFDELLFPMKALPLAEQAKRHHMRVDTWSFILRRAKNLLEAAANTAAADATRYLFKKYVDESGATEPVFVHVSRDGELTARPLATLPEPEREAIDLLALAQLHGLTHRRGVLTLNGVCSIAVVRP